MAFSEDKAEDVNFYLKIVENLTYRQLCILAAVHDKDNTWRDNPIESFSVEQITVAQDITYLS